MVVEVQETGSANAFVTNIMGARNLVLGLLGLAGSIIAMLATSRYGAGLSPDSTYYIEVARALASGHGIPAYFTFQPPLFPAILALMGALTGRDPLLLSHVLNAALFGIIIYVSGMLFFNRFTKYHGFALFGLLMIVVSKPLFAVAVMAWSEPLAICFMLISLYALDRFLAEKRKIFLALSIMAASLACLSRYIGVTIIVTTILALLIVHRSSIKQRITLSLLAGFLASLPLLFWLMRNYSRSGNLFGANHVGGAFTLQQNLSLTGRIIVGWFVPFALNNTALCLLVAAIAAAGWASRRHISSFMNVWSLFAFVYALFLIILRTLFNFDKIDDRLLSPIYVPVVAGLLVVLAAAKGFLERSSSRQIAAGITTLVAIAILFFRTTSIIANTASRMVDGAGGYNTRMWRESESIRYLQNHRNEYGTKAYSNRSDAVYLLTGIKTLYSPARTFYQSSDTATTLSQLQGVWPDTAGSVLIWFNNIKGREFLFSEKDLGGIADLSPVIRFSDATIYSITRKRMIDSVYN